MTEGRQSVCRHCGYGIAEHAMQDAYLPSLDRCPGFESSELRMRLCDDDGIVRGGAMHHGTDYPCTGHAHFAGAHIICAGPAHRRPDVAALDYGDEPICVELGR